MSPRFKLRSAATPLVLAGALWGGGNVTLAAPPARLEDALLEQQAAGARRPAAAKAPAAAVAAKPGAPVGPVVVSTPHGMPAPPMPRQTPPPCSPDGVCIPNTPTFGVYPTRWRTFPGDLPVGLPTEAAEAPDVEAPEGAGLGGPQLPTLEQESTITPQRGPRREAADGAEPGPDVEGAEQAPEAGAIMPDAGGLFGPAPGLETPPGGPLPELDGPPAGQPAPGEDAGDPLDPFGGGPPKPPAWLSQAAAAATAPVVQQQPAPHQPVQPAVNAPRPSSALASPINAIEPASAVVAPESNLVQPAAVAVPVLDGPNLHGDDAPPALPAGLKGISANRLPTASSTMASSVAAPQPTRSSPPVPGDNRGVVQASAVQPMGIQLINPAAAIVVEPGDGGLQQAIYFEASDQ